MAHGPKSKKRRARATRDANRMAQVVGYTGAQQLVSRYKRGL